MMAPDQAAIEAEITALAAEAERVNVHAEQFGRELLAYAERIERFLATLEPVAAGNDDEFAGVLEKCHGLMAQVRSRLAAYAGTLQ